MQESAFLLKELTCEIEDVPDNKKVSYHYENGLISFVDYINEDKKVLHKVVPVLLVVPIFFRGTSTLPPSLNLI